MARINTTETLPFPLARPNPDTPVTEAENIGYGESNVTEELQESHRITSTTQKVSALAVKGSITGEKKWSSLSAYAHVVISVNAGDTVNISGTNGLFCFLKSYPLVIVDGSDADISDIDNTLYYLTGTLSKTVPADSKYLFVRTKNNTDVTPSLLNINGYDCLKDIRGNINDAKEIARQGSAKFDNAFYYVDSAKYSEIHTDVNGNILSARNKEDGTEEIFAPVKIQGRKIYGLDSDKYHVIKLDSEGNIYYALDKNGIHHFYGGIDAPNIVIPSNVRELAKLPSVTIAKDGTGDYSSVIACFKDLKDNTQEMNIYIKEGVYDIFEELGGETYAATIPTGSTDSNQYMTKVPSNVHVIGLGHVELQFLPTVEQIHGANLALNVLHPCGSATFENLILKSQNSRYCIHDETYGRDFGGVVRKYKNVKAYRLSVQGDQGTVNCMGCGFSYNSNFEFEDCFFNAGFYMHDWVNNLHNDYSVINIKDTIIQGLMTLRTSHTQDRNDIEVKISNSYLGHNILLSGASGGDAVNPYVITSLFSKNVTITESDVTNTKQSLIINY